MTDAMPPIEIESSALKAQRDRMAHARAHLGKKKEQPMPESAQGEVTIDSNEGAAVTPEQEQLQWSAEAQRIAAATVATAAKEAAATMSAFENPAGVKDDAQAAPTPPACPSHRTFRIDAAGILVCELCGQPPASPGQPITTPVAPRAPLLATMNGTVINPCRCGHAQADHGIDPRRNVREVVCNAIVEATKAKCACGSYNPAPVPSPPKIQVIRGKTYIDGKLQEDDFPQAPPASSLTPAVVALPSAAAGVSSDGERAAHIATLHLLSLVIDHTRIKAPIGFVADRCQGCMDAHGTISRDRPCQDAKHHLERERKRLGL